MAQKRINDLQLRTDFDDTCNFPTDDLVQTWRVTGAQVLAFVYSKLRALAVVTPVQVDHIQIYDASDSDNPKRVLVSSLINRAMAAKTAAYTATLDDSVILCDATSAAFTLTLPAASTATGKVYSIKKTDSSVNAVTVDANASETIDGATTFALSVQYESISIVCNGTAWFVI